MRITVMAVATMLGILSVVAAAQSADLGGGLAERWCMGCHVIETGAGDLASEDAPTFAAIAANPRMTAQSLDPYLSKTHTTIQDFSLSGAERAALIAYLLSLR